MNKIACCCERRPLEDPPLGPRQESAPPCISRCVRTRAERKCFSAQEEVSFLPKHAVILEEAQESLKDRTRLFVVALFQVDVKTDLVSLFHDRVFELCRCDFRLSVFLLSDAFRWIARHPCRIFYLTLPVIFRLKE